MEVPFPRLGAAQLQTQAGRGGHLLRSVPHTVHRLEEGWGPGGRGLSPEGEMLKGPEKEASSHGVCLSSRREDEVLSLPPAAAEILVLSSWQSLFSQFFLKSGLTLLVHRVEKSSSLCASFCLFYNKLLHC